MRFRQRPIGPDIPWGEQILLKHHPDAYADIFEQLEEEDGLEPFVIPHEGEDG